MNDKNKFQTGNVILISIAHMLHDIFSSFLAPILPLLIDKLKFSYSLAGLLTIFQRGSSLLNPFIGLIADKLPVRYLLIVSPAITAIVMSLLGSAPHYIVLVILLLIMGVSASLFHVPAPVMIRKIAGTKVGKAMSFFMLGGEFARSLGPLVILGSVSVWGLEGTWKLIPFGIAASVVLYFKLSKIKISDEFRKDKAEISIKKTLISYMPLFIGITGVSFFNSLVKASMTYFLPTFITAKGESVWLGGISFSILQFAGAAGTLVSGTISDKVGRRTTLFIATIVSPVLMLLFIYVDGVLMFVLLILLGVFLFGTTPVMMAEINDLKSERPAFLNGIYMTINFGAGAITIMIIGALGDLLGLEESFLISALLGFAAIPFVFKFSNKRH
ncbi:MAG: MFS transporter [Ignavibacteria bacterium]|jgi:FSR family fosmidomycin resistance protein-like MFS transporter